MPTAAKDSGTKPKDMAHRWWTIAAYNGQDLLAVLAALQATGIWLKFVRGANERLSAMARDYACGRSVPLLQESRCL